MGGVLRLEDVSDRVGAAFDAKTFRGFGDARRFMAQRFQQPQNAVGARRGADQDGAHQPLAQFERQIVENFVARRLNVFEQLLHQFVVVVGQRFQHREAGGLFAVGEIALKRDDFGRGVLAVYESPFEREVDKAGDKIAGEGRDLPHNELRARGRLQQPEHVLNARMPCRSC